MTIYYSWRKITDEVRTFLKKYNRRGELISNSFYKIDRADTIDKKLLIQYFDCAVAHKHNYYTAIITLPLDLESRIPAWYVKTDGEVWVDPNSCGRGRNVYGENVFGVEFNFYTNEDKIHKISETSGISVEEALVREFIEVKHALKDGRDEPVEVFRDYYEQNQYSEYKYNASKYLASIITKP